MAKVGQPAEFIWRIELSATQKLPEEHENPPTANVSGLSFCLPVSLLFILTRILLPVKNSNHLSVKNCRAEVTLLPIVDFFSMHRSRYFMVVRRNCRFSTCP